MPTIRAPDGTKYDMNSVSIDPIVMKMFVERWYEKSWSFFEIHHIHQVVEADVLLVGEEAIITNIWTFNSHCSNFLLDVTFDSLAELFPIVKLLPIYIIYAIISAVEIRLYALQDLL